MGGREVREARILGFESSDDASSLRSFRAMTGGSKNKNLAYLPSSLQLPVNLAGSLATSYRTAAARDLPPRRDREAPHEFLQTGRGWAADWPEALALAVAG